MFLSSTGGCKNSTWLELGVRGLLLSPFFFFLLLPTLSAVNLSPSLLWPPITSVFFFISLHPPLPFPLFSSLFSPYSSSQPVVLTGPHVAGLSRWCEPHGRPWLQADAQLGVCVCECVCVNERETVMCSCMPKSESVCV